MRSAGALPKAEHFVFVRDGFSFWAFIAAPWWMLLHRMWLVLAAYVVLIGGLMFVLMTLGASDSALAVISLLVAILIGLEASTLRRFSLQRRGWRNVGIISGDDMEDAERRFFDGWLRQNSSQNRASAGTPPPSATSTPRAPQPPDVLGLFPQPEVRR